MNSMRLRAMTMGDLLCPVSGYRHAAPPPCEAFGLNYAELHMRRGEWAEAAPVSGTECVGIVKSCPGGGREGLGPLFESVPPLAV
jgi:hypothetical protein